MEQEVKSLQSIGITYKTEEPEWVWALVGNIVEEHEYGPDHEIRKGTKHFAPGTKVFLSKYGYDNGIPVIGHPRHGKNYITVFVKYNQIENHRLQKVYKPEILKIMSKDQNLASFYDNTETSRWDIIKRLDWMNPEVAKIERMKMTRYKAMYSDIEAYCLKYFNKRFDYISDDSEYINKKLGEVFSKEQLSIFYKYMNVLFDTGLMYFDSFNSFGDEDSEHTFADFYYKIITIVDHQETGVGYGCFAPESINSRKWNVLKNI